jgi:hypothetical protein
MNINLFAAIFCGIVGICSITLNLSWIGILLGIINISLAILNFNRYIKRNRYDRTEES